MIRLELTEQEKRDGHVVLYEPLDTQSYLGVSTNTIARYRREGWLVGQRFGNGNVYREHQLLSCIRERGMDRMHTNVIKEWKEEDNGE